MTSGSITLNPTITLQDVIDAFESIGFENDDSAQTTTTAELYWGNDTDHNYKVFATVPASGNLTIYMRDATYSNTSNILTLTSGTINVASTVSHLDWMKFGDSILVGFNPSNIDTRYNVGIIAPVGEHDNWFVCGGGSVQYPTFYRVGFRGTAKNIAAVGLSNITQLAVGGVIEIVKFYDADHFLENLMWCPLHPPISAGLCVTANVGSKTYLVWGSTNGNNTAYACFAFDITSEVAS